MKVTYNWLKDFVEIKLSPHRLADKLTMAGLEVKSLEAVAGDFVFEIEITSNRPDWLSVIGIAREVAALTGNKLRISRVKKTKLAIGGKGEVSIKIEDKKDCPFYSATIIRGVEIGSSPEWLKRRLELIGCRSINNVVDITNYILFETGHPLHAFDLDKLGSDIIVRRAKAKEELITLDGIKRTLDPRVLIIATPDKPQAIAGVMGGQETEVDNKTKNILLEAAVFAPAVVRRGRQAQALQSDSAYRFERSVNIQTAADIAQTAAGLIQKIAGGKCSVFKSSGLPKQKNKDIQLQIKRVGETLGVDISANKIKTILTTLGFRINPAAKANFTINVPSYRPDVDSEIDLIEEVARIYGYEKIPLSLPKVAPQIEAVKTRVVINRIRQLLAGLGLNEVITYSLVERKWLLGSKINAAEPLAIENPLSAEQEILRTTLIPSLVKAVAYNFNQKQEYINIFEIAKTFKGTNSNASEELTLGIALSGAKPLWLTRGRLKESPGFLHLKGILGVLLERLGIKQSHLKFSGDGCLDIFVQEETIGRLVRITEQQAAYFDIKNNEVYTAEILLDKLLPLVVLEKKFTLLPLYPGISRDVSIIVKEETKVDDILKAIQSQSILLLQEITISDCYQGKQIPPGFKGITISCLYRSGERTLTDIEINPLHAIISKILLESFAAQLR